METINPNAAMLSNFEVWALLQELKSNQKKNRRSNTPGSQLATIVYEATRYLQETPCKLQTASHVRNFLEALKPFKLTKAEKLMLLNNPPSTPLEVQVMVEESEERLSDEEVERLLQVVQETLPFPPKDDDEPTEG